MAGRERSANLRRAYGFDEVALVPGTQTIDPEDTDISWSIGGMTFPLPFLASAMDAVVDPSFAVDFGKLGGLAVMNLDGLQVRYPDVEPVFEAIAKASPQEITALLQKAYQEPIKPELVGLRVSTIARGGVKVAVSATPLSASTLAPLAIEAGADIVVVASTVTSARFSSTRSAQLDFGKFCAQCGVPVIVGNSVSYSACLELMQLGVSGLLIGVGPGAACTSREVLGIGVPQVTATMDCAAARDDFFAATGKYVSIITDGGMRTGGDICKAFASGADAVMVGSPFAQASEAPGRGYHWGMAAPNAALPRGTRIKVGNAGTVDQILFGPTSRTDGTQNLVGALRNCMGVCGARSIHDMHQTEVIVAPSIRTEGKIWQLSGQV